MFEYEFRVIGQRLNEAIEYFEKARKLRNPGKTVRLFQYFLKPVEGDESYADKQAVIDKERKRLEELTLESVASCKEYFAPILDWLEERGISRVRLSPQAFSVRSMTSLRNWLSAVREVQQLVELTEEAERVAVQNETHLRDELEHIARVKGVNINVTIT